MPYFVALTNFQCVTVCLMQICQTHSRTCSVLMWRSTTATLICPSSRLLCLTLSSKLTWRSAVTQSNRRHQQQVLRSVSIELIVVLCIYYVFINCCSFNASIPVLEASIKNPVVGDWLSPQRIPEKKSLVCERKCYRKTQNGPRRKRMKNFTVNCSRKDIYTRGSDTRKIIAVWTYL